MESPTTAAIKLAKALGLDIERLVSFRLDVNASRFPVVEAVYLIPSADGVERVARCFDLTPKVAGDDAPTEPRQEVA